MNSHHQHLRSGLCHGTCDPAFPASSASSASPDAWLGPTCGRDSTMHAATSVLAYWPFVLTSCRNAHGWTSNDVPRTVIFGEVPSHSPDLQVVRSSAQLMFTG